MQAAQHRPQGQRRTAVEPARVCDPSTAGPEPAVALAALSVGGQYSPQPQMAAIIPPAPQLSGNSTLEVLVHHSASAQGEKLRLLGERQLKLAYTVALMEKRPDLSGDQLTPYIDTNYPAFMAHWVTAYGWRTMMWAVPHGVDLNDPAETRTIFETYAGAVVDETREPGERRSDPHVLFRWIRDLVFIYG